MPFRRPGSAAFYAIAIVLGAAGLAVRALTAFGVPDVVEWDETYYASTTATAAAGIGLYPFVQGYPHIHGMGGIGYVFYVYVLAYQLFGGHLWPLRLVSFGGALIGVAGVSILTARLYGRAAGLVAFAITPSLLVFHLTNSVRLDGVAFAAVAWALVLYVRTEGANPSAFMNAIIGATFGLGLNIHLHTAAAAFAVGVACLRRPGLIKNPVAFAAGYTATAALFLAVTVLPSPGSYVRSAALARLSAVDSDTSLDLTAPMDERKLAASFLSPGEILPKELARYGGMFRGMPWWERALWLVGVPLLLLGGHRTARYPARYLLPGALVGGGMILNSSSPVYFAPLLPFFIPGLAIALASTWWSRPDDQHPAVTIPSLALLLVLAAAMTPTLFGRLNASKAAIAAARVNPPEVVARVTRLASPGCVLAGPTDLYARYFMAYPRFIGTRRAEVLIGSTYFDLQNDIVGYWRTKQPDFVFGRPDEELAAYLAAEHYEPVAEQVWKRPRVSSTCVVASF